MSNKILKKTTKAIANVIDEDAESDNENNEVQSKTKKEKHSKKDKKTKSSKKVTKADSDSEAGSDSDNNSKLKTKKDVIKELDSGSEKDSDNEKVNKSKEIKEIKKDVKEVKEIKNVKEVIVDNDSENEQKVKKTNKKLDINNSDDEEEIKNVNVKVNKVKETQTSQSSSQTSSQTSLSQSSSSQSSLSQSAKMEKSDDKIKIFKPNELNITRETLKISKPMDKYSTNFQITFFLSFLYKNKELNPILKPTNFVALKQYGIPKKPAIPHPNFDWDTIYDTIEKRSIIQIPLDTTNPVCVEFFEIFNQIDAILGSLEIKELLFTKKHAKEATYTPIVKKPKIKTRIDSDDDSGSDSESIDKKKKKKNKEDKENNSKEPPMDYITVKFELSPNEKYNKDNNNKDIKNSKVVSKDREIVTSIYQCYEDENGKLLPNKDKIEAKTIEEVQKYITFMSQIWPVVRITKLWRDKKHTNVTLGDGNTIKKYKYGVGLSLLQIGFKESKTSKKVSIDRPRFDDDSE
jgi:hypothetical protein